MNPHRKIRSSPALKAGTSRPVQVGSFVAALVLIPLLAIGGSDGFRAVLDYTTGVLSLVSLTASVAWGLLATDRLLLSARHRLLAQAVHRTTAVASLGFLLLHGTVKVSLGHVALVGALVPFGLGVTGAAGLIGFGSLAGLLMVVAASTGTLRSALAGRGSIAARWRPLHMLAYPAWCSALIHGLYAGRPAATWVVFLYCLSLAGVAAAVSVRLLPRPLQRRLAERLLALIGPGAARPAAPGGSRRDLSVAPLPGAADVPGAPVYEGELRREPRVRPDAPGRPLGVSPEQGTRTLSAPVPPAYDPFVPPPAAPGAGRAGGRPPGSPGAGISAAYRAVSLGNTGNARDSTERIPLAERIPMTEELPVFSDDPAPARPGFWPTPSPPPPAPSPAPPSYSPSPPPYHPTEPAPGSFQQPPAGEPWTAPAGDRP
ncbi:hypothetical protein ACLGI4_19955 [Streptomyces sp. HMX112]|uniref:hypothetical protein n=1 Tax=Streptomyces sp. HMX112 TaxID=3390850 RepID=UPI003A80D512